MALQIPASDSFAGIPARDMARFLRQARTWHIDGSRPAQAWRFSLSDLRNEIDLEILTAGEAMALIEATEVPGVYQVTQKGKILARAAFIPGVSASRDGPDWIETDQGSYLMPPLDTPDPGPALDQKQREALELFAARRIDRRAMEDQTGLSFGQALVRMAELGIKRHWPGKYEGMSQAQRALFDEVFPPPEPEDPAP